jgi:circadian clock protein KaiB
MTPMHASAPPSSGLFELTLFVNGASELSALAIVNAKHVCDRYLAGRYQLRVVDVHDDLSVAVARQVFATPTLIKTDPRPERRIVGDLSQPETVCRALDLTGDIPVPASES